MQSEKAVPTLSEACIRRLFFNPVGLRPAVAAIGVGSPRLELNMQLDASLGGVFEGSVVLFVLLISGVRKKFARKRFERKRKAG